MRLCVMGGAVGDDGVCVEHGETACVVTVGAVPVPAQAMAGPDIRGETAPFT